jgi:hypothetical protein
MVILHLADDIFLRSYTWALAAGDPTAAGMRRDSPRLPHCTPAIRIS